MGLRGFTRRVLPFAGGVAGSWVVQTQELNDCGATAVARGCILGVAGVVQEFAVTRMAAKSGPVSPHPANRLKAPEDFAQQSLEVA